MYTHFFSLKQAPFSIAPDPRYLFMSDRHREALAHLLYGVGSGGGFVLLTGEIGAGKTTVCRCFLEQIPADCRVAYIFNPKLSVPELLQSVCEEFHIGLDGGAPSAGDATDEAANGIGNSIRSSIKNGTSNGTVHGVKHMVDAVNRYLLSSHAQGQNNVLIIDEAQNLSQDVLEQLRLLTNLETNERKLLQIILIGQPELRAMLARQELEQLAQRVIARYHLGPLSAQETEGYIAHRLAVAGQEGHSPFDTASARLVHQLTHGVPRRINLLCDRALLGAYAEGKRQVERSILRKAASEVFDAGPALPRRAGRLSHWVGGAVFGGALLGGTFLLGGKSAQQALTMEEAQLHRPGSRDQRAQSTLQPQETQTSQPTLANQLTQALQPTRGTQATQQSQPTQPTQPTQPNQPNQPTQARLGTQTNQVAQVPPETQVPPPPATTPGGATQPDLLPELAQLWGETLEPGTTCKDIQRHNLRCFKGDGGLEELQLLDRPAVLILRQESGPALSALLMAVGKGNATLRVGGKVTRFDLKSLASRFDGGFTTLWRLPRRFRSEVRSGQRGVDVAWVAAQLAQWNGLPKPRKDVLFDEELARQTSAFQGMQKLKVDGVVGAKTYMRLGSAAGVSEPRLLEVREDGTAANRN